MALSKAQLKDLERWYELPKLKPVHKRYWTSKARFRVIKAGRRCLEAGTLVATPQGPIAIELLQIGDEVIGYNEDGSLSITHVTNVYNNGTQEVFPLLSGNEKILAATSNHHLLTCEERRPSLWKERTIAELSKSHRIKKEYISGFMVAGKSVANTYSLGALLGDGCSRESKSTTGKRQKYLYVSAEDHLVPHRIATELGGQALPPKHNNYTWKIGGLVDPVNTIPFYAEWCSMRYAHTKIADWGEISTWDKESSLKFLAGIIDTDGSVYFKTKSNTEVTIKIGMQAETVIDCCENIIFKYFQERVGRSINNSSHLVNGPAYYLSTTSNMLALRILEELKPYLVKRVNFDLSKIKLRNIRQDRIGLRKGQPYLAQTYDITVDNNTHLYVLHKCGIVTHNSYKTEIAKRIIIETALHTPGEYFIAAPTIPQVRLIYWEDIKRMSFPSMQKLQPKETSLVRPFDNGSTIHLLGMEKPKRFEGPYWTGGILDEFAYFKEEAWSESIRPALDTEVPGMPKPWCIILSKPNGLNHFYERYQYALSGQDPNWEAFEWTSEDVLSLEAIIAAKQELSLRQYKQEYLGEFVTATGRIYDEYCEKNYTSETIQDTETLHYFCDFNYTPMSHGIAVVRNNWVYVLDEVILEGAKGYMNVMEFCERYKTHKNKTVYLYGDSSGSNGAKHGLDSEYSLMKEEFRKNGWNVTQRVKAANPAIKDRQNAVNALICNALGERKLFVNPAKAIYMSKGLLTTVFKKGSTFIEEQANNDYQHITTALGYFVDHQWPVKQQHNFESHRIINPWGY